MLHVILAFCIFILCHLRLQYSSKYRDCIQKFSVNMYIVMKQLRLSLVHLYFRMLIYIANVQYIMCAIGCKGLIRVISSM